MSSVVRFLWRWLYRRLCHVCDRIMWPWQPRHKTGHAACVHRQQDAAYVIAERNYGILPWDCRECGRAVR